MNDDPNSHPPDTAPESLPTPAPPAFWSPWATVVWGILVAVAFVTVQLIVMAVWMAIRLASEPDLDPQVLLEAGGDGDLFATATLASAVICSALVWLVVKLKRGSNPPASLALVRPSVTTVATWLFITAIYAALSDALTIALGRPIVPEFMTEIFRATTLPALLCLGIIIGGPIFEELFIRGFLFEGLRRSSIGEIGAVVVCSLFWAAIHLQYGLYEITTIFIFGLILGAARIKTGSLWVPVAMHTMVNLVATVETIVVLRSTEALPI